MRFRLPDYVINTNLLKAIEKDNVSYVSGTVNRCPWLRTALFYSEQMDGNIGLFENFFKPPLVIVTTLFMHAIRHSSSRVIEYLKPSAKEESFGYVVDDIDDNDPYNQSYRVHKVPVLCFCHPKSLGYRAAVLAGINPEIQLEFISKIYRGVNYHETKVMYNGFWEFAIGLTKQLVDPNKMNDLTNDILTLDYDCNRVLRMVDLNKLFSHYFGFKPDIGFDSPESTSLACYFLQIFIKHGCVFSDKGMANNVLHVLSNIVNFKRHTEFSEDLARTTLKAIMILIPNTKYVRSFPFPNLSEILQSIQHDSLKNICLRYIRWLMGSKNFTIRVKDLPLHIDLKHFLINIC